MATFCHRRNYLFYCQQFDIMPIDGIRAKKLLGCRSPIWQRKGGMKYRNTCILFGFRYGKCDRLLHLQVARRKRPRQLARKKAPECLSPRLSLWWNIELISLLPTGIVTRLAKLCKKYFIDKYFIAPPFLFALCASVPVLPSAVRFRFWLSEGSDNLGKHGLRLAENHLLEVPPNAPGYIAVPLSRCASSMSWQRQYRKRPKRKGINIQASGKTTLLSKIQNLNPKQSEN